MLWVYVVDYFSYVVDYIIYVVGVCCGARSICGGLLFYVVGWAVGLTVVLDSSILILFL